MDQSQLQEIYDRWIRKGMPVCRHERARRLYDRGDPMDMEACTECGRQWNVGDTVPAPSTAENHGPA